MEFNLFDSKKSSEASINPHEYSNHDFLEPSPPKITRLITKASLYDFANTSPIKDLVVSSALLKSSNPKSILRLVRPGTVQHYRIKSKDNLSGNNEKPMLKKHLSTKSLKSQSITRSPEKPKTFVMHTEGSEEVTEFGYKTTETYLKTGISFKAVMFGKTFGEFTTTKKEQEVLKNLRIARRERVRSQGRMISEEVVQLQNDMLRGLNKSKEKKKIEELKNNNAKHKEIKDLNQEIKLLRTISNSQAAPNTLRLHKPSNSVSESSTKVISDPNKQNSGIYYMSTEYNPSKMSLSKNLNANLSVSKINTSGPHQSQVMSCETPYLNTGMNSVVDDLRDAKKVKSQDPFNQVVMYKDEKMPFSLALTAKLRQSLFKEVKHSKNNMKAGSEPKHIIELRNNLVPGERAKFLVNLDVIEKQKKYKEMKSKNAYSNAMYQYFALDKFSQKRLKSKLEEHLPGNSRFLNL